MRKKEKGLYVITQQCCSVCF